MRLPSPRRMSACACALYSASGSSVRTASLNCEQADSKGFMGAQDPDT